MKLGENTISNLNNRSKQAKLFFVDCFYPAFCERCRVQLERVGQLFGLHHLEEDVSVPHVELPIHFVEGMIRQALWKKKGGEHVSCKTLEICSVNLYIMK